jgi:hypothetical protein
MSALKPDTLAALAIALAASGCRDGSYLSYEWDDRRVLCSAAVDDLTQGSQSLLVEDEVRFAADQKRVALFHAHKPGVTISRQMIDEVLTLADRAGLEYITYRELVPGPRRAGIALAFDDNAVEEWLGARDLLDAHHARVTFFITRYAELSDAEHEGIAELAAEGHDIQPHTVHHLHARTYEKEHGVDGYLQDEVLPSIDVLEAAGFPRGTTFAYPFGEHTRELDAAILQHIDKIRVSPGSCPY